MRRLSRLFDSWWVQESWRTQRMATYIPGEVFLCQCMECAVGTAGATQSLWITFLTRYGLHVHISYDVV